MTLIIDTAPLISLADADDPESPRVLRTLERERGDLVLPAPVTAEVDYFLTNRLGRPAPERFVNDIANGLYRVEGLTREEHGGVLGLMHQYRDLAPGLVDLSIVVLAYRFNTTRILTFDQRHFRAMQPLQGGSFTLLPFDEPAPERDDA